MTRGPNKRSNHLLRIADEILVQASRELQVGPPRGSGSGNGNGNGAINETGLRAPHLTSPPKLQILNLLQLPDWLTTQSSILQSHPPWLSALSFKPIHSHTIKQKPNHFFQKNLCFQSKPKLRISAPRTPPTQVKSLSTATLPEPIHSQIKLHESWIAGEWLMNKNTNCREIRSVTRDLLESWWCWCQLVPMAWFLGQQTYCRSLEAGLQLIT